MTSSFFAGTAEPHLETEASRQREERIRVLGALVGDYMALAAITNYAFWRAEADRARIKREALIHGRSAAQVARMEAEKGLA